MLYKQLESLFGNLWLKPLGFQITHAIKKIEGIDDDPVEGELWSSSRIKNVIQEEVRAKMQTLDFDFLNCIVYN